MKLVESHTPAYDEGNCPRLNQRRKAGGGDKIERSTGARRKELEMLWRANKGRSVA